MGRRFAVWPGRAGLAGALMGALACGGRPAVPPAHLLLVSIDTLRADHVGCYGRAGAQTPHLDSLCSEGVVFDSAFAPAPVTLASHASMMTGLYPASHGLYTNGSGRLAPEFRTLAEALRPRLKRAGAVVGSVVLDARFGLDQGFDDYDDRMPPAPLGRYLTQRERPAESVAAAASAWIRAHSGEPFFLWVHFYDPHAPYDPPPTWKQRLADPYDGEIAAVDEALGQVLQTLRDTGVAEQTLIVVAGDHGEDLGEHGEPTHGVFLYDSTLRVPLIFRHPATLPRGRRVPGVVRLVDLMPTLLELLGQPLGTGLQGQSLAPLLRGEKDDLGLVAFCESRLPEVQYGWARLAALREREWMFIRAPEEELYALRSDPGQKKNLARQEGERAADLGRRLAAVEGEVTAAIEAPRAPISEELRRQLESLGYIGAPPAAAATAAAGEGSDPKQRIQVLASLNEAGEVLAAGRAAEAEASLRGILAIDPGNRFALRLHARSLAMLGRQEEARVGYEKLLALAGEDAEILNSLGGIALRLDRLEEAEQRFRRALEVSPGDARALNNLAFILARRGQTEEAVRLLEAVVKDDPLQLDALLNLSLMRERMGQTAEAEGVLRRAREQVPGEPSLAEALASLLARQGRPEEGTRVLEGALEANPRPPALKVALAELYERLGKRAEAGRLYREVLAGRASAAQQQTARAGLSRLSGKP